jgi:cobalamin biosynthesis protein CobT
VRRLRGRPALAALLLVDLSGSMQGEKIAAATAATLALSAAMADISSISLSVMGFQDVTIRFVGFDERADPHVLRRVTQMRAEVDGKRPGGNNRPGHNDDGPCLLEAAATLRRRPEKDRLLIVISDGSPSGCRSTPDDLHRAVAEVQAVPGTTLVGLGLDPSTDHVTRYYPVSRANIALGDLARRLGGCWPRGCGRRRV